MSPRTNEMKQKRKKKKMDVYKEHPGTIRTSPRLYSSGRVQSSEGINNLGVNPVIDVFFETLLYMG